MVRIYSRRAFVKLTLAAAAELLLTKVGMAARPIPLPHIDTRIIITIKQNTIRAIDMIVTGKPPFTYRLLVDGVMVKTITSPNPSQTLQWTANSALGIHTLRGEMTDSCPNNSQTVFVEKTVNIVG